MTNRQKRIRDFERRTQGLAQTELSKLLVDGKSWSYILVHPISDDVHLLKQLGISAKDCFYVGCYLRSADDVFFLEVVTSRIDNLRPVGLYARWELKGLPMLHLYAVVRKTEISRKLIESIIIKFSKIDFGGFKGKDKLSLVGKLK